MIEFLLGLVSSTKSVLLEFDPAKVRTESAFVCCVLPVRSDAVDPLEEESCQVSSYCFPEVPYVSQVADVLRSIDTTVLSKVS